MCVTARGALKPWQVLGLPSLQNTMKQLTPPVLTPLMQALMPDSPRFWACWTMAPKWALLPEGMVEWNYRRKPNQLGDVK